MAGEISRFQHILRQETLPKDYGLKVHVSIYDYLNKKLSYINIFD